MKLDNNQSTTWLKKMLEKWVDDLTLISYSYITLETIEWASQVNNYTKYDI
jgi:hypothetical protein